ncbi:virulence protein RhuM/Fic/DOC family protein [Aliarcobacter cryaerophilus]|uniref:virulence protein RhuM/Fic/DOC family protein n=1 Tax=Aliarcobacter cryaerophilus TaxID=28198 RepID=UPI0021B3BC13|nr:virulence protein RhuM/Fic/DOC family protein [Aliarcobacter cryaerophilus]MCT7508685.1 virulence RhuM family protein [Aliarcobacter cryaerophilus]
MFLNKDIEIMETKIVIYEDANGEIKLDVSLENDTLWLSQKQLEVLFDRDKSVISRHIKNIFKEEELDKNSVVAKNATTATDGKIYQVEYYNLDMIISLGYRVNSKRATSFRVWATKILKDYIIKGHPFNDGNKRIGAFMFILFLSKNNMLYKSNGELKINDNALVALSLMTAKSDPKQKDTIINLIVNILQ